MKKVRILFEGTFRRFYDMAPCLSADSSIVQSPEFENAVVMQLKNKQNSLNRSKRSAVGILHIQGKVREGNSSNRRNLFAHSLRTEANEKFIEKTPYMDTRFICSTSNAVERLSSKVGYVLSSRHHALLPTNFENRVLLHIYADLWPVSEVKKIVYREIKEITSNKLFRDLESKLILKLI